MPPTVPLDWRAARRQRRSRILIGCLSCDQHRIAVIEVLQPVRPAMPGRFGDRPAVVIFQFHQQPADHLIAALPGLPPGKHPATRPGRSASSADRASSATVTAATAAS
jgi:hypothetical protein